MLSWNIPSFLFFCVCVTCLNPIVWLIFLSNLSVSLLFSSDVSLFESLLAQKLTFFFVHIIIQTFALISFFCFASSQNFISYYFWNTLRMVLFSYFRTSNIIIVVKLVRSLSFKYKRFTFLINDSKIIKLFTVFYFLFCLNRYKQQPLNILLIFCSFVRWFDHRSIKFHFNF